MYETPRSGQVSPVEMRVRTATACVGRPVGVSRDRRVERVGEGAVAWAPNRSRVADGQNLDRGCHEPRRQQSHDAAVSWTLAAISAAGMHAVVEGQSQRRAPQTERAHLARQCHLAAVRAVLSASDAMLSRLSSKRTTTAIGKTVGCSAVGDGVGEGVAVAGAHGVGDMATVGRGEFVGVGLPHAPTGGGRGARRNGGASGTATDARTRRSAHIGPGRPLFLRPSNWPNGTPSPSVSCDIRPPAAATRLVASCAHRLAAVSPERLFGLTAVLPLILAECRTAVGRPFRVEDESMSDPKPGF